MDFNLEGWKNAIRRQIANFRVEMESLGIHSAYAYSVMITLLPIIQGGEPALQALAASVGGNLLSSWLEKRQTELNTPSERKEFIEELMTEIANHPALAKEASTAVNVAAKPALATTLATTDKNSVLAAIQHDQDLVLKGKPIQVLVKVEGNFYAEGSTHNQYYSDDSEKRRRAREQYLHSVRNECSRLYLPPVTGQDDHISLEAVYTDLDTTSFGKEEDNKEQSSGNDDYDDFAIPEEPKPLTAEGATKQHSRLVILGDPGGGKSTFVRRLVARHAQARLDETLVEGWVYNVFPILTVLRELIRPLNEMSIADASKERSAYIEILWTHWREMLQQNGAGEFEEQLLQQLTRGDALLVFDGLDEVPGKIREKVRTLLGAVTAQYPKIRHIIVTCRIRSYSVMTPLANFTSVTLAPFTGEKIDSFITAWYATQVSDLDKDSRVRRQSDLQSAVREKDMSKLASNPMLLTAMAQVHGRDATLPKERVRIYSRLLELLLPRWQLRKGIHFPLSDDLKSLLDDKPRLNGIMERLAYEGFQSRTEEGDLEYDQTFRLLRKEYQMSPELAVEFLRYVDERAGVLTGKGGGGEQNNPDYFGFAHQTLQEYLAGRYLVRGNRTSKSIVRELHELAIQRDFWQVPIEFAMEQLARGDEPRSALLLEIAYALMPNHPRNENEKERRLVQWTGRMASLVSDTKLETSEDEMDRNALVEGLIATLLGFIEDEEVPAIERVEAGRLLGELGDPRPEVMDVDAMQFCWIPKGRFWMGSDHLDYEDEHPEGWYTLDYNYWLAKYPVTHSQFKVFVEADGYQQSQWWDIAKKFNYWSEAGFGSVEDSNFQTTPQKFGVPYDLLNHPVVGISWFEALAYTNWLTVRWHRAGFLPSGWQVTLPNEPEWEKGGRGGKNILESVWTQGINTRLIALNTLPKNPNPNPQRRYPWGDVVDPNYANYEDTRIGTSSAVGCFSKGESPYGSVEMSGNVVEWQRNIWKSNYPYQVSKMDTLQKYLRTGRGGSFDYSGHRVRCSYRSVGYPQQGGNNYGIRLAIIPVPPFVDENSEE